MTKQTQLGYKLKNAFRELQEEGILDTTNISTNMHSNALYDGPSTSASSTYNPNSTTSSTNPFIETIRTIHDHDNESSSPTASFVSEIQEKSIFQEMYNSHQDTLRSFFNKMQDSINKFHYAITSKKELPCSEKSLFEESINNFNADSEINHGLIEHKSKYEIIFLLLKLSPQTLKDFNGLLCTFAESSDFSLIIDLPAILWALNEKGVREVRLDSFNDISEFTKEVKEECSKLAGFVEQRAVQEKASPVIKVPEKIEISESESFTYNQRSLFDRLISGRRAIIGKILLNVVGTCILGTGFMATYNMYNAIDSSRIISNLRSSQSTVGLESPPCGLTPPVGSPDVGSSSTPVVPSSLVNWEIYKPTFFYPGTDIFSNLEK